MFVETLVHNYVLQHEKLPGAAFHVDRAFTQFLYRGGHLQRLFTVPPALLDKMLDNQPAAQCRAAEQKNDHHEAGQHALAK